MFSTFTGKKPTGNRDFLSCQFDSRRSSRGLLLGREGGGFDYHRTWQISFSTHDIDNPNVSSYSRRILYHLRENGVLAKCKSEIAGYELHASKKRTIGSFKSSTLLARFTAHRTSRRHCRPRLFPSFPCFLISRRNLTEQIQLDARSSENLRF